MEYKLNNNEGFLIKKDGKTVDVMNLDESQVGEVYDISANHADTKYADLTAALGTNGANVPQALRKGGMSIKFVLSSDNKYIQYFLTKDEWSINLADWMEYAPQDKLIKLVGISPNGSTSNVTKVGDVYFNTTNNLLRRCVTWNTTAVDSIYITVPFIDGAIYTYNNMLYVYDGTTLISKDELIFYSNKKEVSSFPIIKAERVPNVNGSIVGEDVTFAQISSPCNTRRIEVQEGLYIKYPTFLSSLGLGSCFVDSNNKFISGYSEQINPTGSYKSLKVPHNAKYFYIGLNSSLINNIELYEIEFLGLIPEIEYEISTLDPVIKTLNSEFSSKDLSNSLKSGYFDLSVGIGNTVNISQRTPSSRTQSACVECQGGDIFSVAGYGGESSRLWGFIDEDNKLISVASPSLHITVPIRLEAPENAKKFIYQTIPAYIETIFRFEGDVPALKEDVFFLKEDVSKLKEYTKQIIDFSINNDSYYEDGIMLLAMKTNVPNNQIPFNLGYLYCKWNDNKTLYYGINLNEFKEIKFPDGLNNKTLKYAISPKDGRIIMTVRNGRGSLYVWDSVNMVLTTLEFNSASQKPMGWLYNSGCCFDNDANDNEICLFAEYSQSPTNSGGFNIWRGTYPYTNENLWEVVMHVPYVGDDASGITHFHQVRRDPWTGIIYATSGDASAESKWWYSTDHGLTFNLLTTGATSGFEDHICRIINFIFTEDKVYFATDHGTNHCLNSIERNSQTGVLDVSTRLKMTDLPYGQATNFLCYSEFPKGIFMYDRWDIGYSPLSPIKVQFYSLETQTLIDVAELQISGTWGGHRGGCYVDYLSTTMGTPAMGFDLNSPCIFKLNNPNVGKIGTIFYDILSKVIHTI